MGRYNIQLYGAADSFIKKINNRKKTIIINAIISEMLKSNKVRGILQDYFSETEIDKILSKDTSHKGKKAKNSKEINRQKKIEDDEFELEI